MSAQSKTTEYLLLFRGAHWDQGLDADEVRAVVDRFTAWFERLQQEGKAKGGQPLEREGRIVSGKNGRQIVDGPFAESKEAIGGYFLLEVADLDEAVAIARQCPTLEYGAAVEVRPVGRECGTAARLKESQVHATV